MRDLEFGIYCRVLFKDGKFHKILLDANDWGDYALDDIPDLSQEEYEYVGKKTLPNKLDWDWL